jgi:hypothetical protein
MRKSRIATIILCAVAGFGTLGLPRALAQSTPCVVDPARELMIRDLSVVDDCVRTTWGPCPSGTATGAWTFGNLIAGVAGTNDPVTLSNYVLSWLSHWERTVTVNGFDVPPRNDQFSGIRAQVINPWLNHSPVRGQLDMRIAPFRLLAIVNRVDLRTQPAYGNANAGEARFVFGVLNLDQPSAVPPFTVIFEYGIQAKTCDDIKAWAQRWHALGSIPFGETYNAALQSITDTFTRIGANPKKPNGSAINQVRSNEIALAGPWELREFFLPAPATSASAGPTPLIQTTVKQTPNHPFQNLPQDLMGSQLVADYINEFQSEIIREVNVVPAIYHNQHLLGAATVNFGAFSNDFWNGPNSPPITNNEARFHFSLNTCNACHGRETLTQFLQVAPRAGPPNGQPAALSGFLTGITGVPDPVDPNVLRDFNDLQRRASDLCFLLNTSCLSLSTSDAPLGRVH